jgi:hypothetical protein
MSFGKPWGPPVDDHSEVNLLGYEHSFDTPILIVFWRRPESVTRLIDRIRPVKPTTLFLACDGARDGNDDEHRQVLYSRRQVEQAIDWPCSIMKRYSEINLGVKYGPYSAINWFFSYVNEGIILEDDCLPEASFLPFCAALLERFRDDERIWQISGNNFVPSSTPAEASYLFSKYPSTWGWASWRRCWCFYDIEMKNWPELRDSGMLANAFDSSSELEYWTRIWDRLTQYDYPLAWDYQWIYACLVNGALSIVPGCNLVSNIGFGHDGTNCLSGGNSLANLPTSPLLAMRHARHFLRDRSYDQTFLAIVRAAEGRSPTNFITRLLLTVYFTAKGVFGKFVR